MSDAYTLELEARTLDEAAAEMTRLAFRKRQQKRHLEREEAARLDAARDLRQAREVYGAETVEVSA